MHQVLIPVAGATNDKSRTGGCDVCSVDAMYANGRSVPECAEPMGGCDAKDVTIK